MRVEKPANAFLRKRRNILYEGRNGMSRKRIIVISMMLLPLILLSGCSDQGEPLSESTVETVTTTEITTTKAVTTTPKITTAQTTKKETTKRKQQS